MTKRKSRNLQSRIHKARRKPDALTIQQRSARMSKIRATNTAFEAAFARALASACPQPFDQNCRDIFGKPDFVFRPYKVCVFLDSDFWHGWQFPRWKHKMKNDFWRGKIIANRRRDLRVNRKLRQDGWRVVRIWEHDIQRSLPRQIERVRLALDPPGDRRPIVGDLEMSSVPG